MTESEKLDQWLAAMRSGKMTRDQVIEKIQALGTSKEDAEEILFFEEGGSDVIKIPQDD